MRFDIITIFPEMFAGVFSGGIIKRALDRGLVRIAVHDLRDFTQDKHRQVDDRPFGGLEGMVLKPEPIFRAVEAVREDGAGRVYLLSPQGRTLDADLARELAAERQVILICGRYEGVDERVVEHLVDGEISIGDYVLSGGELAAAVVVDAASRFVPGVVGKEDSVKNDSFAGGILDYPQYTRPREFRGMKVPQVLFSGDHKRIERWRRKKALEKTVRRRPDLVRNRTLAPEDRRLLEDIPNERKDE
ncbi:MAG: tRNA (guanosine(37)-N1)-methyltransferase TrmD [Candidatus Aminicenantes bacterium RBG_16_63_14]|nr:MAG: tRNA (guanosine(37)-N1)-methyltransferase TrmD [Candidatus Aminicenantes bacterium RBG_16_63_14]OGD29412.1 MAG: tRNA (guanosine(37)-N1)-methyltransferase TrmD [Candidatus Aminicenantes bacterium RBG_19FT_COMBO_65_30]